MCSDMGHSLFLNFTCDIGENNVNIEIFAQYIFSGISRRVLYAQNVEVSENYNHNRKN